MSATTAGCRCTSKRKCPWTSCTPRAPSPSPSSAPSAACGKCSRYASRPGDPRARPHSHPGRVLLPSRLLRQPRFHVGTPPTVRKRSQTTTPEPAPFAPGAGTVRGPAPALVYVGAPPTVRKRSQTPTTEPAPFAPGAGTVRGPAPALVYVGAPPSVRKRSQTTTPEPAPIRTRGGCSYHPDSCASPVSCRSTALGAKAESNHNPRARPHSHPGRVLLPSGLLRQPRFHVGAPPTVRKRSQTTTPEPAPIRTRGGCSYSGFGLLRYVLCRYSVKGQAFMCSSLNNCEESKAVSSLMHAHIPVRYFLITAHWACIFFLPRDTSAS